MAIDSSPESGPISIWAPFCSMSRRVCVIMNPARSFPQPYPTIWIGCPAIEPPTIPAEGLLGFFGFAPVYSENAAIGSGEVLVVNEPKSPWQSDTIPILIGVAEAAVLPELAAIAPEATRATTAIANRAPPTTRRFVPAERPLLMKRSMLSPSLSS